MTSPHGSTYIPKMSLTKEQPKCSRDRVYFNEIKKNIRVNHDLSLQELDPNDRMDIVEDNNTKPTNSSKMMDIIG